MPTHQLANRLGPPWLPPCCAESLSWNPNPAATPGGLSGVATAQRRGWGPSGEDVKRLCWQRVLYRAGIEPHHLGML